MTINSFAFPLLNKYLDVERYPLGSALRQERIAKQSEYIAKMIIHILSNTFLAYIMADSNFNHWTMGGKYERLEFFDGYPCLKEVPDYITEYYLFKLGYFSYELIFHTIFHRNRPDFTEMILHHFVTV